MRHFKFITLFILSTLLTSCYTTKEVSLAPQYKHSFLGNDKSEIVKTLGEPARTITDENKETLIYEKYEGEEKIENRKYLEITFDNEGKFVSINTNYTKQVREIDKFKSILTAACIGGGISTLSSLVTAIMLIVSGTSY